MTSSIVMPLVSCRGLYEARGLKFAYYPIPQSVSKSRPLRGSRVEILFESGLDTNSESRPLRGSRVEIQHGHVAFLRDVRRGLCEARGFKSPKLLIGGKHKNSRSFRKRRGSEAHIIRTVYDS